MSRQWTSDEAWASIPESFKKKKRGVIFYAVGALGFIADDFTIAEFLGANKDDVTRVRGMLTPCDHRCGACNGKQTCDHDEGANHTTELPALLENSGLTTIGPSGRQVIQWQFTDAAFNWWEKNENY